MPLTKPVKLHVTGFTTKILKVSQTSLPIPKKHNQVAKKIHWLLWKKFHLECNDERYKHVPDSVLENEGCKVLLDFPIQTDIVIEHRRPDIV